jgi:hypothetical protein
MRVADGVRARNKFFMPPIVPGLIAADRQQRDPARMEGVKNAIGPPLVLNP